MITVTFDESMMVNPWNFGSIIEGAIAQADGRDEKDDPYPRQPAFSALWRRGWREAKAGNINVSRVQER